MHKYEKFWDRISNRYANNPIKDKAAFNEMVDNIRNQLTQSDNVLDFGCGTSTYSIAVADKVKCITAIDISKKMQAIATERATDRKLDNIRFEQLSLFDPKLLPGSFDAVLCFNILHLQEDLDSVMYRIAQLLSKGGKLVSKTVCIGRKPNLLVRMMKLISKTGWIPHVACFDLTRLNQTMENHQLRILTTSQNPSEPMEYFVVAQKIA